MPGRILAEYDRDEEDDHWRVDDSNLVTSRRTSQGSTRSDNLDLGRFAYQRIKDICEGRREVPRNDWLEEKQCTRQDLMDAVKHAVGYIKSQVPQRGSTLDQSLVDRVSGRMQNNISSFPAPHDDGYYEPPTFAQVYNDIVHSAVPNTERMSFANMTVGELRKACNWAMRWIQKVKNGDWVLESA